MGCAALARPGRLGLGAPPAVVRLLGARMALQGLVLRRVGEDRRRAFRVGAATDGLHAASMVAAAMVWSRYRRPALVSAAVAATTAAAEVAAASR